jgi:hypothetical protein
MAQQIRQHHSYRCYLQRSHQPAETGVREFVQLRAPDAQVAARAAIHVTGAMAVVEVERQEPRS